MSKEWKGNKKSVSSMLGMSTTWHPEQRAQGDYYTSSPAAVAQFLDTIYGHKKVVDGKKYIIHLAPWSHGGVYEPACGCGNISKELLKLGIPTVSTDLYDRGYGTPGIDFLKTTSMPDGCKNIITNPPYSLADEFVKHAMEILPEDGYYVALMNINYLAGKKRYKELYSMQYLNRVYIYPHRINCYKNNEPAGHSSSVNYGWFVFSKQRDWKMTNYQGVFVPPQIFWIDGEAKRVTWRKLHELQGTPAAEPGSFEDDLLKGSDPVERFSAINK